MTCTETKRYLEPFLDGELDAEGNLKVLEHLNLCADCNRVFDAEKTLRGALRDRGTAVRAPEGLADRCRDAMNACDAGRRRRWVMPAVSAAAAAVIAAIVTSVLMSSRPAQPNEPELASLAVAFHEANRTGTSGDATWLKGCQPGRADEVCDKFFTQKTGSPICTHPLDGCGYGWRSAVVSTLRGRMMCWTVQENQTSLISHTVLRVDQMRERKTGDWRRYDVNGRVVLMQNMGPVTWVFVTDDAREAEKMVAALSKK